MSQIKEYGEKKGSVVGVGRKIKAVIKTREGNNEMADLNTVVGTMAVTTLRK